MTTGRTKTEIIVGECWQIELEGWWLQRQIERLQDFFLLDVLLGFSKADTFFFFLCTNPKTSHDSLCRSQLELPLNPLRLLRSHEVRRIGDPLILPASPRPIIPHFLLLFTERGT